MRKLTLALLLLTSVAAFARDVYVVVFDHSTVTNADVDSQILRDSNGSRAFWFRRDGREYVVTDAHEVERARAIVKPQAVLGEQQAALGAKQAALGMKQAALGMRMAALGRDDAERAGIRREQRALRDQQETLRAKQEELRGKQEKLRGRVEREMRELEDECIRNGEARAR
ncbi:MAG TPA: hypothetical protein VJ901_11950 [Thermoanaerobaculia bacterium]|nr:hypothetical protein [Thermoanaerobaculia bacterium]